MRVVDDDGDQGHVCVLDFFFFNIEIGMFVYIAHELVVSSLSLFSY